jgi:lipopolysaccharide/colanic/teichoic acid biosynthesis glycosyltransferase
MLAIAVDSRGPVLFRQERVGRFGRQFVMYKFRTMVAGAEHKGGQITPNNDPRVTHVGNMLRSLKIDELPQLINVIRGEMSLVGPRPEVQRYVDMYTEAQREVLVLMPGITDPASIRYRDEGAMLAASESPENLYRDVIMPDKIRLNLEYARRATLLSDLTVILHTLTCFLGR